VAVTDAGFRERFGDAVYAAIHWRPPAESPLTRSTSRAPATSALAWAARCCAGRRPAASSGSDIPTTRFNFGCRPFPTTRSYRIASAPRHRTRSVLAFARRRLR
jgi:hypothetical protein